MARRACATSCAALIWLPAPFYNYFKDKDEIFEAVVGEADRRALERRHLNGRAKAETAEDFFRRHLCRLFRVSSSRTPSMAGAGAQELHRHPHAARQSPMCVPSLWRLNDDIRSAIARAVLPNVDVSYLAGVHGGHRLRDLGGHGGARPGSIRRSRRVRHPPDDGRAGPRAATLASFLTATPTRLAAMRQKRSPFADSVKGEEKSL